MSLEDDLQEISGVGEATASKIMTVFEDYDSGIPEDVRQNIADAYDYYEDGKYEYAGKFLRRAWEDL